METRLSYALVGLFVLLLGGAFVAISLWLMGVGPRGDYRVYALYPPESVAGIASESLVRFLGVDVGKVREVGVDPKDPRRVRLLIDVRHELPIQVDTTARIATQGLTGLLYYIEITPGEPGSPPLEILPGAPFPVIQSAPSDFSLLQQTATELLEQSRAVAEELRDALAALRGLLGEDEQSLIREALAGAARTAAHLSEASAGLGGQIARLGPLLDELSRALTLVTEQGGSTLGKVGEAARAVDQAAQAVDQAAHRMERLAVDLTPGAKTLSRDGMPELTALLRDLRTLTGSLDRIVTDLGENPNQLLFGRPRRPGPGER